MRRREFIAGLGGAAAWPLAVRAQQQSLPVIGFLRLGSPEGFLPAFRRGLTEAGYVDGQNVMIEVRWANNNGQLQGLAEDLVRRQPAVIVASGSVAAIRAANAAASTVPIAFLIGVDPMEYGLVASLNRPGGTITGISVLESELAGKQLNLLLEMAPQATKVAYLSGPARAPIYEDLRSKMVAAAQALEREIIVLEADSPSDIETVFVAIVEQQAGALIVGPFISLNTPLNRPKIIELAARYAIPAMYPNRVYADFGGLMSYSAGGRGAFRQLGAEYVAPILRGAKPADLPVRRSTKFELVINRKTAKALSLTVPLILLAMADEVIE